MDAAIYLDHQATTPLDPQVREAMLEWLAPGRVGNPHAAHAAGRRAADAVERARAQVAALIGARPEEIVFTSGATEANNLALQGMARAAPRRRLLASRIEHRCVLQTLAALDGEGCEHALLPVDADGRLDPVAAAQAIGPATALVSLMLANNELGTLQPVAEIAALCRHWDVPLHCDAAQAVGKVPVDVHALGVDLLSLSGHKLYGPGGIGALFVSAQAPRRPRPLLHGGGQERGLRAGTLPTALCVALGEACAIAAARLHEDAMHAAALRQQFLARLAAAGVSARVHGAGAPRLPGCLSLRLEGIDAPALLAALQPRLALSTGAACSAHAAQPSHVLRAIGLDEAQASATLRLGFGRGNTPEEVERAAAWIAEAARAQLAARRAAPQRAACA